MKHAHAHTAFKDLPLAYDAEKKYAYRSGQGAGSFWGVGKKGPSRIITLDASTLVFDGQTWSFACNETVVPN
ncbi:MAG: hypothetical protein QNJ97_08695 [Myxococcota bacterium]|nr:hypothetical protein [Myxococcota bacterium]